MPTVNEKCDRVHLINVLEKEGICLKCSYCTFLKKLKNRLQELNFFYNKRAHSNMGCAI